MSSVSQSRLKGYPMNKANAIILAAGRSQAFAPFSYEKPKGLFQVNGEVLIERQIKQLQEAGIDDIYVVIGFMKEKFFYLEKEYGVHLLFNNGFDKNGNLVSLYIARAYLGNTFVCCADHYFVNNPFTETSPSVLQTKDASYRACVQHSGDFREFSITLDDQGFIDSCGMGGSDSLCMVGEAYFTRSFSKTFVGLLEQEIDNFGVNRMFWEEFWAKHKDELPMRAKLIEPDSFYEFDSLEEIRAFDNSFLESVDSQIIENITSLLKCKRSDVKDIAILNKGLSNVLFLFTVHGTKYVYRHPGGSSDNFANRRSEAVSEKYAGELKLDETCIYVDEERGWKISYFIEGAHDFEYTNKEETKIILQMIKKLHDAKIKTPYTFDVLYEADKLMRVACNTKGDLFSQFKWLRNRIVQLYHLVESDGVEKVLCHNDCYQPNFLMGDDHTYLIDWEFSAMTDPANDFGGIVSRENFSDAFVEELLETYLGHQATPFERRHFYAYVALTGYYFFCWSLFKDSIGEDSGSFMLNAYNNAIKYYDLTINDYQNGIIE